MNASTTTCQNEVVNPISNTPSDIASEPPIKNGLAPYRSTRNPYGVCNDALASAITATDRPSSEKLA